MSTRPSFDPLGHDTPQGDLALLSVLAEMSRNNWHAWRRFEEAYAVEIGSWAGRTALAIATEIDLVFCVDTWRAPRVVSHDDRIAALASFTAAASGPDHVFRTFCANMRDELYRSIIPCRGDSLLYASVWPHKAAMVFIDADHSYEAVKADILAWRPHVIEGGILCGHDYGGFEGVTRAVDELIPDRKLGGTCMWWTTV